MLAAAPAAGVIVPATRSVQTLGKQKCFGSVNISSGSGSAAVKLTYGSGYRRLTNYNGI